MSGAHFTGVANYPDRMALNEEALKQFIARLPDRDQEHERNGLGGEEIAYLDGLRDAYRVLTGSRPRAVGIVEFLLEHAEEARKQKPNSGDTP